MLIELALVFSRMELALVNCADVIFWVLFMYELVEKLTTIVLNHRLYTVLEYIYADRLRMM
jgi:hypothetical protein